MRNSKTNFLLIIIVLLFILLCLIVLLIAQLNKEEIKPGTISTAATEETNIKKVLEENECELSSQDGATLYVVFPKDLYNEDGSGNETYFEGLVDKLIEFFSDKNFYLVDNEKSIRISVIYDYKEKEHKILYNEIEGFYSKTNGKDYVAVEKVKIVKGQKIFKKDEYLEAIYINDGFFSIIKDALGDGVPKENGYVDYLNGTLSIRLAPNNTVKNIIYKKGYKDVEITTGVTINTTLREIYDKFPNPSFGSVDEGFLCYRSDEFYIYYYNNEISIYDYGYTDNYKLENTIENYLGDGDLDKFATTLLRDWKNYDSYRYDPETKSLYLLYANRGIEINIVNNDSRGITLYSNYYFTDKTKKFVKNGLVTLKSEDDLIDIIESKRRDNTLEL